MDVSIKINSHCVDYTYTLVAGAPVAPLLKQAGLLDFPCGGIGKCGKCLIYANTAPCAEEVEKLGTAAIQSGLRLACYTHAAKDLEITIPDKAALCVLSSFTHQRYDFAPVIDKTPFALPTPAGGGIHTDVQRLLSATGTRRHTMSLRQLAGLPAFLHSLEPEGAAGYALTHGETIVGYSPQADHTALVVDIGTTTVAAILVNLRTQRILGTRGAHNAQFPYGADVISRINQTMDIGVEPLRKAIISQLECMRRELLIDAGLEDVSVISLAGNTTMMHLLCGLPPEDIGKAPFRPVTTEEMRLGARELGLDSDSPVHMLPSISSYIGADIVASLLACGAHDAQKPFLLIDFGTNAETVLFANNTFYCCSAAAGPCFEGASLSCGMAGQPGAIDTVECGPQGLSYTVIENIKTRGLCGSGVLDALAVLLDSGAVDETGRLNTAHTGALRPHLDAEKGFVFTPSVYLTQADIREIQLAKGAIRTGVEVLCDEAGIAHEDIDTLYLAGGFGSAMRAESAVRIGLIPPQLLHKVDVLGNATSFGALRYITERDADAHIASIMERTKYIELSTCPTFTGHYMENMLFPAEAVYSACPN